METTLKSEITLYYKRLKAREETGVILHAWSDGEEDGILSEIIDFYIENKDMLDCDWFSAFYQIYIWEYQSFHEGVDTYYTNFYKESEYDTILKTAQYLKQQGFLDVYQVYLKGVHDYRFYDYPQYPKEWLEEAKEIDAWINDNIEAIYHCMFYILVDNMSSIC